MGRPSTKIPVTCEVCQAVFLAKPSSLRRYCSKKCYGITLGTKYRAARKIVRCAVCGESFEQRPTSKQQYCSAPCRQVGNSRKGADIKSNFRNELFTAKPTTYRKTRGKHTHRVVIEQKLGRPLMSTEVVHHIDGNRHNNSVENLVVLTQSEHARLHMTKNRVCSVPGCGKKHVAKGFCQYHWRYSRKQV